MKLVCKNHFLKYYESDENFLGKKDAIVNYVRNFNSFVPADRDNVPKDYATMGKFPNKSIMMYTNESSSGIPVPYKKSEPTRCDYLSSCMVVRQDGNIVPCFQKLSKQESAYCNVNELENIMDILKILSNQNEYVAKINRDNYINGAFEECKNCFTRLTCR